MLFVHWRQLLMAISEFRVYFCRCIRKLERIIRKNLIKETILYLHLLHLVYDRHNEYVNIFLLLTLCLGQRRCLVA